MNTVGLSGWNGFCNRIWINSIILMNYSQCLIYRRRSWDQSIVSSRRFIKLQNSWITWLIISLLARFAFILGLFPVYCFLKLLSSYFFEDKKNYECAVENHFTEKAANRPNRHTLASVPLCAQLFDPPTPSNHCFNSGKMVCGSLIKWKVATKQHIRRTSSHLFFPKHVLLVFLVAPSLSSGATYLVTMVSVCLYVCMFVCLSAWM